MINALEVVKKTVLEMCNELACTPQKCRVNCIGIYMHQNTACQFNPSTIAMQTMQIVGSCVANCKCFDISTCGKANARVCPACVRVCVRLTPCRAVNFISNSFGRIKCLHKINIQVEPQDKTTTTTTATSCSSSTDSTERAGAATVIVTVIPTATTMLMANQMKHNIKLIVRAENKTKDLGNKLDSTRPANWNVLF